MSGPLCERCPPLPDSCPFSTCDSSTKIETVIVKTAPKYRLDNEREVLERFQGRPCIRQLIDEIQDPPSLVLKYFDDNLLNASNSKRLERSDIKFVAKKVLEALKDFHEVGYVHTGTILILLSTYLAWLMIFELQTSNQIIFSSITAMGPLDLVKLSWVTGGVYRVDLNADPKDIAKEDGHIIGAAIFRSPEAMLNLKWGIATDIWSFGATMISLIWGKNWHIFKPDEVTIDDEAYPVHVLIKQANVFGPFPLSYQEIAEDERLAILTLIMNYSVDNEKRKPFSMVEDPELTKEDREFIYRVMKLDPRHRLTAKELLLS